MSNRLAKEKSPYLLQHKDNPVDWWPWAPEAFERAVAEDKPVFLSIGYATCHWCHVMERESFEDHAVASLMNAAFINVKVDREERPDIDAVYMTVCQLIGQRGGWPLTIFMTPERKPFFAATYIPKTTVGGRYGMMELIPMVQDAWDRRRQGLVADADRLTRALAELAAKDMSGQVPDSSLLHAGFEALRGSFDPVHGGFGDAPKFPSTTSLRFLLRYWKRTGKPVALQMVGQTLAAMRSGGIYDHVGGGFHRYATDRTWTLPHFEKMLYDQATMVMVCVEAFQAIGEPFLARTAHETLRYVLHDMVSAEGGFYSAEDADSEGHEGKYYVWTHQELRDVLGESLFAEVEAAFNVRSGGNFRDERTRVYTGENVLHTTSVPTGNDLHRDALDRLFAHRSSRVRPLKDDKVLADWNGIMIAAMARAGRVLQEPVYVGAAESAASFVRSHLMSDGFRLLHRWRDGSAAIPGMLDDYACMVWGLIELYEATFESRWLADAQGLCRTARERLRSDQGGYFQTPDDGEELLVRSRPSYDSPVASGNAVMMMNLLRLGHLTHDTALIKEAWTIARTHAQLMRGAPTATMAMFSALDFALGPAREVIIAGYPHAPDTGAMLRALAVRYLPNVVVCLRPVSEQPGSAQLAPYLVPYRMIDGKATAYVCEGFSCQAPVTSVSAMLEQLGETKEQGNANIADQ